MCQQQVHRTPTVVLCEHSTEPKRAKPGLVGRSGKSPQNQLEVVGRASVDSAAFSDGERECGNDALAVDVLHDKQATCRRQLRKAGVVDAEQLSDLREGEEGAERALPRLAKVDWSDRAAAYR